MQEKVAKESYVERWAREQKEREQKNNEQNDRCEGQKEKKTKRGSNKTSVVEKSGDR